MTVERSSLAGCFATHPLQILVAAPDVKVRSDGIPGLKQNCESSFFFIQELLETVAGLIFALGLIMTHPIRPFSPHATHDVKLQNTQHTRPRPPLTPAPSLHRD